MSQGLQGFAAAGLKILTLLNDPDREGAAVFIVGSIAEYVGDLGFADREEGAGGAGLGGVKCSRVVNRRGLSP